MIYWGLVRELKPPQTPVSEYDTAGQANRGKAHKKIENLAHGVDALGFCLFTNIFILPNISAKDFFNAVTGKQYTFGNLLKAGGRISMLPHAFKAQEGLKFTDRKAFKAFIKRTGSRRPFNKVMLLIMTN